jgi:branched-chain amino acid transport system ATP-binding protein
MTPLLDVQGLATCYARTQVLWDVSFSVDEGKTVALIGSNGAGKTTILNTVCGILRPSAGEILFRGCSIARVPAHQLVPMGLVQVPEGRELFARMTVRENLELAAYTRSESEIEKGMRAVIERFPILGGRQQQLAGTLSGGEQQMLAIARGLMARPRLLILDEPSWGLAPMVVDAVFEAIRSIRADGTTILLVEQNAAQALAVADYGYVLEHGRIVLSGPASDLARNDEVARVYLGGQLLTQP